MGILQNLGQKLTQGFIKATSAGDNPSLGRRLIEDTTATGLKAIGDIADVADRSIRDARSFMDKMGLQELRGQMDEVDTAARMRAGKSYASVLRAIEPLKRNKLWDKNNMTHIVDLIENPGEVPRSKLHKDVAEHIHQIYDEYGLDAEDLELPVIAGARFAAIKERFIQRGMTPEKAAAAAMRVKGVVKPFAKLENYFTHYFDEATVQSYLRPGSKRESKIQELLSRGVATTRQEAGQVIERMLRAPGEYRGGVLQHTRDLLEFTEYDRDIEAVMKRYLYTSARRLEIARKFGNDDRGATDFIDKALGGKANWRRSAYNIYRAWAGTTDPRYSDLARATGTIHAITMLSTAGIIQPAQMLNTAGMIGWGSTLKGIATVAKDWRKSKLMATEMGAIFDNVHRDFVPDSYKSLGEMWSKIIGLDGLDRINRVASSIGGRFWFAQKAKEIAARQASPHTLELFKNAGLNIDDIVASGGKLSEEQLRRGGLYISNSAQFASGVLDLPEWRNTPAGRFMYLFKSFALQQTKFVKDHIMEPIRKHNDYRPLLRWSAAGVALAPVMADTIRKIKNREAPDDEMQKAVEDLAMVGGYGMFFDAFRAMANGPQSIANWVMGPTLSETFQFLGSDLPPVWQNMLEGEEPDYGPLTRHFISRVPLAGQWMKQAMLDD